MEFGYICVSWRTARICTVTNACQVSFASHIIYLFHLRGIKIGLAMVKQMRLKCVSLILNV